MRRKRRVLSENPDRWLVSYADFITLLFALFTTLYAISRVDEGKFRMFSGSVQSAFRSSGGGSGLTVIDSIRPVLPGMAVVESEIRQALEGLPSEGDVTIRLDERGLVVSFGEQVLFESGEATVRREAARSLASVGGVLARIPNRIVIEGHTDSVPVSVSGRYTSNWELSAVRATGVLNFILRAHRLPPDRFSAAGYGEYRPVASNATPEGRARNRRVDIVILAPGSEG